MKNLLISALIIVGVIICVVLSSVFVSISLRDIEDKLENDVGEAAENGDFETVESRLTSLREEFRTRETFLSLLISDGALEEVENGFSDLINYARAKSLDGVLTAAERLHNAIENIRIHARISLKSVF